MSHTSKDEILRCLQAIYGSKAGAEALQTTSLQSTLQKLQQTSGDWAAQSVSPPGLAAAAVAAATAAARGLGGGLPGSNFLGPSSGGSGGGLGASNSTSGFTNNASGNARASSSSSTTSSSSSSLQKHQQDMLLQQLTNHTHQQQQQQQQQPPPPLPQQQQQPRQTPPPPPAPSQRHHPPYSRASTSNIHPRHQPLPSLTPLAQPQSQRQAQSQHKSVLSLQQHQPQQNHELSNRRLNHHNPQHHQHHTHHHHQQQQQHHHQHLNTTNASFANLSSVIASAAASKVSATSTTTPLDATTNINNNNSNNHNHNHTATVAANSGSSSSSSTSSSSNSTLLAASQSMAKGTGQTASSVPQASSSSLLAAAAAAASAVAAATVPNAAGVAPVPTIIDPFGSLDNMFFGSAASGDGASQSQQFIKKVGNGGSGGAGQQQQQQSLIKHQQLQKLLKQAAASTTNSQPLKQTAQQPSPISSNSTAGIAQQQQHHLQSANALLQQTPPHLTSSAFHQARTQLADTGNAHPAIATATTNNNNDQSLMSSQGCSNSALPSMSPLRTAPVPASMPKSLLNLAAFSSTAPNTAGPTSNNNSSSSIGTNLGNLNNSIATPPGPSGCSGSATPFNDELRRIITEECNIIYECKECSNLYRSLTHLIKHKKSCSSACRPTDRNSVDSIARQTIADLEASQLSDNSTAMFSQQHQLESFQLQAQPPNLLQQSADLTGLDQTRPQDPQAISLLASNRMTNNNSGSSSTNSCSNNTNNNNAIKSSVGSQSNDPRVLQLLRQQAQKQSTTKQQLPQQQPSMSQTPPLPQFNPKSQPENNILNASLTASGGAQSVQTSLSKLLQSHPKNRQPASNNSNGRDTSANALIANAATSAPAAATASLLSLLNMAPVAHRGKQTSAAPSGVGVGSGGNIADNQATAASVSAAMNIPHNGSEAAIDKRCLLNAATTSDDNMHGHLVRNSSLAKTLLEEKIRGVVSNKQPSPGMTTAYDSQQMALLQANRSLKLLTDLQKAQTSAGQQRGQQLSDSGSQQPMGQTPGRRVAPKRKFLEDCIQKVKRDKLLSGEEEEENAGSQHGQIEGSETGDSDALVIDSDAASACDTDRGSQTSSNIHLGASSSAFSSSSALLKALTRPVDTKQQILPRPGASLMSNATDEQQQQQQQQHQQQQQQQQEELEQHLFARQPTVLNESIEPKTSPHETNNEQDEPEQVERPEEDLDATPESLFEKYSCDICRIEYDSHAVLMAHTMKDHKQELVVYPCIFCSLSFISLEGACRHIIDIHGKPKSQLFRVKTVVQSRSRLSSDFTSCSDYPQKSIAINPDTGADSGEPSSPSASAQLSQSRNQEETADTDQPMDDAEMTEADEESGTADVAVDRENVESRTETSVDDNCRSDLDVNVKTKANLEMVDSEVGVHVDEAECDDEANADGPPEPETDENMRHDYVLDEYSQETAGADTANDGSNDNCANEEEDVDAEADARLGEQEDGYSNELEEPDYNNESDVAVEEDYEDGYGAEVDPDAENDNDNDNDNDIDNEVDAEAEEDGRSNELGESELNNESDAAMDDFEEEDEVDAEVEREAEVDAEVGQDEGRSNDLAVHETSDIAAATSSQRAPSSEQDPQSNVAGSSATVGGGIMKLKIQLKTRPDEKSKVYEIV